jgi:hypothetical protein
MQVDWLSRRVDLAALRGRLQQAESQLSRNEPLHKAGLITDENYEQLKTDRQAAASQVDEQSRLVAQMEPIVRSLAPRDEKDAGLSPEAALLAAIRVQDAKLKLAEEQLGALAADRRRSTGWSRTSSAAPERTSSAGDAVVVHVAELPPRRKRSGGFASGRCRWIPRLASRAPRRQTRGVVRRSAATKACARSAAGAGNLCRPASWRLCICPRHLHRNPPCASSSPCRRASSFARVSTSTSRSVQQSPRAHRPPRSGQLVHLDQGLTRGPADSFGQHRVAARSERGDNRRIAGIIG